MFGFQKNDRYTSIAIYAFLVLSLLMLGVVVCINVPYIFNQLLLLLNVLRPVTFAFVFAYICNPIVRYTERKILKKLKSKPHLARTLAITLSYLFILIIVTILLFMIVPQIIYNYQDFTENIVRYINLLIERLEGWLLEIGILEDGESSLGTLIHLEDLVAAVSGMLGWLTAQLGAFGLRLLETTGVVLIGTVLSIYILYHKETIWLTCKKIMLAVFPQRVCRITASSVHFADRAFGQFIIGKLIDSFIVGVITFIVLAIVQMPYYPLISAIVCVTSIIPAFGYVIGAIPSFLIIFVKDPFMALWFLVILIIIQQLDGNIIGPKIVGSATGLASVWVITAIMLMGAYLGPIGWFVGVPLFSVLYRMAGDFVNYRLKKKGRPISLAYYENTPIVSEPISGEPPAQADAAAPATDVGKEESDEKVDE
ncbi:MAG: AI-2E family transporter [Clostridia bacterium]|nr:AI-2E family transporter [Clostridia bacterium]